MTIKKKKTHKKYGQTDGQGDSWWWVGNGSIIILIFSKDGVLPYYILTMNRIYIDMHVV